MTWLLLFIFSVALAFLFTLSDTFHEKFGGLDWWINDIHRNRLAECYLATGWAVSLVVPLVTQNIVDICAAAFFVVLFVASARLRWGLSEYRVIAFITLAMFALSVASEHVTQIVFAKDPEPAHRVRQKRLDKKVPIFDVRRAGRA